MKTIVTFYELLGISPQADPVTVRKAYRKLARKHHPDVSSDPRAHENMARINEAFATLIHPDKRREYDAALAGGGFETRTKTKKNVQPITVKLQHRLRVHKTPIYGLTFLPDSSALVSSSFDNEMIWWDPQQGKLQKRTLIEAGTISTIRALGNGQITAAGSAESLVSFYRVQPDGTLDAMRNQNDEWVSCLAISSDGSALACGSLHHTFAVTDTATGVNRYRRLEHAESVTAVAWSADGKFIATGSADASVKIWHASNGALLQTIQQVRSTVTAVAFSSDNKFVVVAAVDLSLRVFRLSDGVLVKMMFGHTKPIETLAFHPNNWLFASGSRDGTVGLWNAEKGIANVRIEASSRPVSCVAFSPDGAYFAAAGQDKTVRIWEVATR